MQQQLQAVRVDATIVENTGDDYMDDDSEGSEKDKGVVAWIKCGGRVPRESASRDL